MGILSQNIVSVFVARISMKAATVGAFIVLARGLSAEDFGIFGILTSAIFVACALGSLGLRQAVAYRLGQGQLALACASRAVWVAMPLGAIIAGAMLLLLVHGADLQLTNATWVLVFLALGGNLLIVMHQGVLLGAGRINFFNFSEIVPRLVLVAGVLALWGIGGLTLFSSLAIFAAGFMIALWRTIAHVNFIRENEVDDASEAATTAFQLLCYGWPYAVALALIMVNTRVGVFALASIESTNAAGQFFAAVRINEIFLETATAAGLGVFAYVVRMKDARNIIEKTARLARILFWFLVFMAIFGTIFAPTIIYVLLGPSFLGATGIFVILMLGLPFAGLNRIFYQAIAGLGSPILGITVYIGVVALNIIGVLWAVPIYGLSGAAAVLVTSQIFGTFCFITIMSQRWGVPVRRFLLLRREDFRDIKEYMYSRFRGKSSF